MLRIVIPGQDTLELAHLVCDLNGTLAEDGLLLEGVAGRLTELARSLTIHLVSADTYGTGQQVAERLRHDALAAGLEHGPQWARITTGADKERYVRDLEPPHVVTIGNGANDAAMFRVARLSIAVLGAEGTSTAALLAADVVAQSATEALDLLLLPDRLVATLRP